VRVLRGEGVEGEGEDMYTEDLWAMSELAGFFKMIKL